MEVVAVTLNDHPHRLATRELVHRLDPDACDTCPDDALNDSDSDGVCDGGDVCLPGDDNVDLDGNGTPDACEGDKGAGDCGCATTAPMGGWILPLLALVFLRRRT